ncbi:MAG: DUF1735 and LamG domain-containing protein [Prevotella sp.]|nr:DUF1735 and LamG domain-containing protein [Prevotella sp.]
MNKIFQLLSVAVVAMSSFALIGCVEGDDFDYDRNGLLITGTESSPLQKFVVEDTPANYPITVSSTKKVDSDVELTIAIDTTLVAQYNKENGTNYYAIPDGAAKLDATSLKIQAGMAISSAANVEMTSTDNFQEGRTYLIPVTITGAKGGSEDVIEASRTIFLRVSRIINFYALENAYRASSNFIFDDSKAVDLPKYTIEFKVYPYSLGTGIAADNQIQRVLAIEGKNEDNANMFRFGESGTARNCLQWILPGGRAFSSTLFGNNRWYLISCTYDGNDYVMYVDGVKDAQASSPGKTMRFQRFELGMSYQGYNSGQFFNGRICEVRLWSRVLPVSEIKGGIAGVDQKSSGLVAYWKMNQNGGTTILDVTGNGYDMDWSKTQRAIYGDNLSATPDAANYIKFVRDDNNKVSQ